jgi:hypothetical protein
MLLETPKADDLKEDLMNLQRLCTLVEDPVRIPTGLCSSELGLSELSPSVFDTALDTAQTTEMPEEMNL